MGDMGFQASENQGQWQFNGTGNGAITRQNTFGIQGTQNATAFYMGLKTVASNQAIEMEGLKGTIDQKNQEIVDRDKQIDLLKARCDTLEGTIDKFARDYHTLNGTGGDGGQITFLTDLGPMPTPWKRDEHPEVTLWMKREWARVAKALALAHKGESSGDSPDVAKAKPKVGCPSKKDQEDADHKYLYLQGRDGVKISAEKVSKMSIKAKSVWDFLHSKKMAPPQFGKMEWPAWDLYKSGPFRTTQAGPATEESDRRTPARKTQKTVKDKDVLDDPSLVRMKSGDGSDDGINDTDDSIQPAGHVSESDDNRIDVMTPEPEDAGFPEADDASEENPGPSAQSPPGPNVPKENPGSSTQSRRQKLTSAQTTHLDPVERLLAGVTPTATTNEASPPRPRIVLKFGPLAKSTVAQGNQDPVASPVPSEPTQTPTACPSDIQTAVPVHTSPPPIDAPIPNLRLERAMANQEKKRKAEGKTTATTSKKQKTTTTLAEPTGTITIKNICIRQWNERQPGSQGLAADFDAYFKGLSDADKEPFKKEMHIAQAAARKAKTAAKKPGEVPSAN
ncbi:hypothetical protein EDB84DRAFT_1655847 [Lactarius hengduanensis]|nr:hypothetical protein EDB84DRAFT_1655847 [Lactarius hengduanensis]